MKKIFLSVVTPFCFCCFLFAQPKQHKIVFDFTKPDTASFSTVIRHVTNIMKSTGNAQLEIVCHGPGLDLLVSNKTTMQKEIAGLKEKYNVVFAACEVTMQRRGVTRDQLVMQAVTVPAAILEMSSRQQEGWSYIKE